MNEKKPLVTIVPLPTSEKTVEARWAAGAAPKDFPVLVSAASWRVDFLVTGNKKHFDGLKAGSEGISEAKSVSGSAGGIPFRIIDPAELMDNVLPEALREDECFEIAMTKASFPWLYVITNAVWIFGLAVVLAAFGWTTFWRIQERGGSGSFSGATRS